MEIRPTPEGLTGTMSHDKYMQASQWDALMSGVITYICRSW